MANSDRRAALKGVNDLGDLVLEADGEIFLLEADESVERAVLSAAQIRRENEEKPEAKQSGPLPISAIQALIRSGASVSQTARDFSIDDALVRRFAKPVETEKQYAIEQFLQAACPADARGRTIQEVIFDTLSSTRANAKTIEWTAVRRNREPWRIKATFEVNEKITRAEFSWNMRANAVICLNTPAKLLLRQIQPESINLAGSPLAAAMGYSAQQTEIPALNAYADSAPVANSENISDDSGAISQGNSQNAAAQNSPVQGTLDELIGIPAEEHTGSAAQSLSDGSENVENSINSGYARDFAHAPEAQTKTGGNTANDAAGNTAENSSRENVSDAKSQKKKSKRSAVPSWDEILFG